MSLKDLGEKIDGKLDKIDEHLSKIDVTLVKQNAALEHHIFRTDLAEEGIELNKQNLEMLRIEFKPVLKRHETVDAIFRITGAFATGLGLIVGISKVVVAIFF